MTKKKKPKKIHSSEETYSVPIESLKNQPLFMPLLMDAITSFVNKKRMVVELFDMIALVARAAASTSTMPGAIILPAKFAETFTAFGLMPLPQENHPLHGKVTPWGAFSGLALYTVPA